MKDLRRSPKTKRGLKKITMLLLVIFLMAMASFVAVRINGNSSKKESQRTIDSLSKILLLDKNLSPTVAKVEDVEILKKTNPDFYKDVQTGDYIIIYSNRAIIYRENENKVINIAPIVKS